MKTRTQLTEKTAFAGEEPEGSSIDFNLPNYKVTLMKALSWYGYDLDQADGKKYAIAYARKFAQDKVNGLIAAKEIRFNPSRCWVMRMMTRGAKISPDDMQKVNDHLEELMIGDDRPKKEKSPEIVIRPKYDNSEDKLKECLGDVEGVIDDYLFGGKQTDFIKVIEKRTYPKSYSTHIIELVSRHMNEMRSVLKSKSLQEAWSYLTPGKIKKFIQFLEGMQLAAEQYVKTKIVRKPSENKPQPISKLISNLNYKLECPELNIKSESPSHIIGAKQLWVYSTKYNRLGVYNALDATGLSVSGTSITNYDENTSIQKMLKKPKDELLRCKTVSESTLNKMFDQIKTSPINLRCRVGENIILVRVVK